MLKSGDLEFSFQQLMVVAGGANNMATTTTSDWKNLPMELLLRIVSLVDDRTVIRVSGVCNCWRDAISLGLAHLSLSWCKNNMNNLVLSLAPKLTNLQSLSLRQAKPQLEDNAIEAVANCCHDLQELDLSKSLKLSDRSLYALAHGCPHLAKLNISGCPAFSDAALAYLTGFCKNLKSLNLCGCVRAASDRALQAIAYNCGQLQYLNLGWCEEVSDLGVTSLAFGCPHLRALDLCGCILITGSVLHIEPHSLHVVGRSSPILLPPSVFLPSLVSSTVAADSSLDESVVALANGCLHLRSLGLYYCQNITDKAMYSLANSRVKGKHDLWESVKNRYNKDEGLVNLNISQCTALTPPAVQAVCDSFPALHTCPGRHSLIISGCLNLTSVHCACGVQAHHRAVSSLPHPAH